MNTINKKTVWNSYRFTAILFLCIAIGSILGIVMGERALIFKPLGDIYLNLMFTIVTPLVFCMISRSISNMVDMKRLGKILGYLMLIFLMTSIIAAIFMLIVTYIFPPGQGVKINITEDYSLNSLKLSEQIVKALTVEEFSMLLSRRNMMALMIFSIFFGLTTTLIGEKGKIISQGLDALCEIFLKIIGLLMYYAPIGISAYIATLVAEYGPELIGTYANAIIIYYLSTIVFFFFIYFLYTYLTGGMQCVKVYFKHILQPAVTSLATCSSIATLPVTLKSTADMGVPKDINDISIPLGTTMHMDGTCLSSILKITFLFGIFDIPFVGIEQYLIAILITILSAFVMAGVPGGGAMGEMLIITMYGFPPEALPIIVTIGYLIDPPATMLNVTGDPTATLMLTRVLEGKKWIKEKFRIHKSL